MRKLSRRSFITSTAVVGAAAVGGAPSAVAQPQELSIRGSVAWCNRARGLLMFQPEPAHAAQHMIRLDMDDDDTMPEKLKVLVPTRPVTVRFVWRPAEDVLAPWKAVEVVTPNGESFAALQRRVIG